MGFQRARSEEQRQQRRDAILSVASQMLAQMPVAEISLNELSRRVGLAKSNVLRYFDSREAILLDLFDQQLNQWATELDGSLVATEGTLRERIKALGTMMADSIAKRPIMCDLASAQAAVLERNITVEVALSHKQLVNSEVMTVVTAMRRVVPEFSEGQAYQVVAHTLLMTAGAWPQAQPSSAVQGAYDTDPEVARVQMDFRTLLYDTITLTATGLICNQGLSLELEA